MSELENGFRLSELMELIRRRRVVVIAAALVGLVLAYVVFTTSPTKYSATAKVRVQPVTTDPFDPRSADTQVIDVATEHDLVKSDAVAERVRAVLKLDVDTRTLMRPVTVSSKPDSLVLDITYVAPKAATAQIRANAIADSYLAQRSAEAEATQARNLIVIDKQIATERAALLAAQKRNDTAEEAERQATLTTLTQTRVTFANTDTSQVGRVVRRAPLPGAVLSKLALGKAVGVLGLSLGAGLALAIFLDRSDAHGGGRRRVARAFPDATLRVLPSATGRRSSASETAAAVDRLAVELAGSATRGKASSVLLVGTHPDPPVDLAQSLSASLSYAGIPALFVLAGTSDVPLPQARIVTSFTDLLEHQDLVQRALPAESDRPVPQAPITAWLKPRGSAESSGLLRQNVVKALITQSAREGYEVVVFIAGSPTHNAAATALGQWVAKTAIVIVGDDSASIGRTVQSLRESDATVAEVVWT
jgi:capsular polysaccharide biosynthesis protein